MALRQTIRFCKASDGTRIAVASAGRGPPLVRAAHWLSHVEYDLDSPVWRHWVETLSRRHTYVRYDQRGCGLSDWDVSDLSFDALTSDLEAVVDSLGLERFPLIGMSQGGAIAMNYALRHPERVSCLVLVGAYARGALLRAETEDARLEAETLENLMRIGWGHDNPAFRQVFTNLFIPGGRPEQHQWWNDLERRSATPENAARILHAFHRIEVSDIARRLRVPTLVMHARWDARIPFEEGRHLASLIPEARFVPLDSSNHILLEDEPAWRHFLAELHGFLEGDARPSGDAADKLAELTPSELEVLRLVSLGLANRAIAERLEKREKTVRNQFSSVLSKLELRTRAEAIVFARDNGIASGDASY